MRRGFDLLLVGLLFVQCEASIPPDAVPPASEGNPTTSTTTTTFALSTLFLGETDRLGDTPSGDAWRAYGFDLDGLWTTETSTNVCHQFTSSPPANQDDGILGIDNAFGSVCLPLISFGASISALSANANKLIVSGAWTLQIQVVGLSGESTQTATGLGAQVFVSGALGAHPAFDSTTDWPVLPSALADGKTIGGGALVQFSTAYVRDGTFVARDASAPLSLPIQLAIASPWQSPIATLVLRVHDPIVTFDAVTGDYGTIAGVLDTEEAVTAATLFAHELNAATCPREAFSGFANQIRQAQDILSDETNRAGVSCNAISIGLGFVAKRVANPTKVGVDPPKSDPCTSMADAGPFPIDASAE